MEDQRIVILRDKPVNKAINHLAAPAIVGMLVMAIYNFVDTVFVSWIDPNAPSATQVVLPVMLIASAIGLSLGVGGGSFVSRLLGAGNKEKAHKVASTVMMLGIIFGAIVTVLNYLFMEDVFIFFGMQPDNRQATLDYGTYILLGYTFMILNMVLNNLLRSEGSAKYSMIGMGIGSLLNILLDPLFIFGFHLDIAGAAMATTLSNMVSFLILLSFFLRKKTLLKLKITYISADPVIYKEIFVVGLPTFFRQLLVSLSMKLLNNAAYDYGGIALMTTIGIVIRVVTIPSYVVFGFGQGLQPVAGYNFGAKQPKRVMEALKYTLKVTTTIMVTTALIFVFFGFLILKIFQMTDTIEQYAIMTLRYQSIGLLFLGVVNTITVFFQALGKSVRAMILSISRQGFFFIPMILIVPQYLGAVGVMVSQSFADILTFILAVSLLIPCLKKSQQELCLTQTIK